MVPARRAIRYDRERYNGRRLIENAFCCLKIFYRVATRYDKLAANFLSSPSPPHLRSGYDRV